MDKFKGFRPFFTYYGGKFRIANRYPLPQHDTIIEPFAGAAGYSMKYFHKNVILNDIDPILYNLWKYLISVSKEEILALPSEVEDVRDISAPQEAKWLIGFWLNSGSAQPRNVRSTFGKDDPNLHWSPNFTWNQHVKERIASQVKHIRHWKIHSRQWYELEINNDKNTYFIDPPYQKSGKHYKHNRVIYPALADWCRGLKGQVIVCEQQGAKWMDFRYLCDTKASNKGSYKEVIWTNEYYSL